MSLQRKVDLAKPCGYAALFVGWFIVAWLVVYAIVLSGVHSALVQISAHTGAGNIQTYADTAVPYFGVIASCLAAVTSLVVVLGQLLGAGLHLPFSVLLSAGSNRSATKPEIVKPAISNGSDKRGLPDPNPLRRRDEDRVQRQPVAPAGGSPAASAPKAQATQG
ncbi:hypothetical protein A2635_04760 [Candidatus Peribacteria bacterium RIFCSPHIGHO2_01_FULL_51_9]|nr:MAG: hypothetical protein A2635_04760 [Candidatus Peribacteria bacterium RIFCSPHIGHO2_01_FULL_51_9]